MATKILVTGAVRGNYKAFFSKVASIHAKHGPFELLLCTGDFFDPSWAATLSDSAADGVASIVGASGFEAFDDLIAGKISVPVPAYVLDGGNPIPFAIASVIDRKEGDLCENLVYLGNHGALKTTQGLRIFYLNGSFNEPSYRTVGDSSAADSAWNPPVPSLVRSSKSSHFNNSEVQDLIGQHKDTSNGHLRDAPPVDILLTYEWPAQITRLSPAYLRSQPASAVGKPQSITRPQGAHPLAELVAKLKPRYHFAQKENMFFEREPFAANVESVPQYTRFVGLAEFGGKAWWFYAMNLARWDPNSSGAPPPNATQCPFEPDIGVTTMGPPKHDSVENYFWSTGGVGDDYRGSKRRRDGAGKPPPPLYVCNKCKQGGHYIKDCPVLAEERANGDGENRPRQSGKLPEGYVCRICNEAGHHIRDCPDAVRNRWGSGSSGNYDAVSRRDPNQCWFCLSNPTLESHLVVSINAETYVTVAKGALTSHHVLVIPIAHFPSTRYMEVEAINGDLPEDEKKTARATAFEVASVKRKVAEVVHQATGERVVAFEVFAGMVGESGDGRLKQMHAHIQLIPLPSTITTAEVLASFDAQAVEDGLVALPSGETYPSRPELPYCRIDLDPVSEHEVSDGNAKKKARVEGENGNTDTLALGEEERWVVYVPSAERVEEFESTAFSARGPRLMNLQFGRLVLSKLLGTPERADWKRCVQSDAEETAAAEAVRNLLGE
ncbi:CwfJ C-terminus 1-domain-containing protein-like protein [Cladochytrium replicatum]|nr:CwfJ C-terminus 1-domain-containing protein-like protein [Cladochytrium replicatum]